MSFFGGSGGGGEAFSNNLLLATGRWRTDIPSVFYNKNICLCIN